MVDKADFVDLFSLLRDANDSNGSSTAPSSTDVGPSRYLPTRTHVYITLTLIALYGIYSAWRRHAVKCLVPLPGPEPDSFLLGEIPSVVRLVGG